MKPYKNIFIRWLQGCLIFFAIGCTSQAKQKDFSKDEMAAKQTVLNAYKQIAIAKDRVENGDIITRTGNDFTSQSLKSLNRRDCTWSHCGIAVMENDSLFVYHALGGEWNPDEKIKKDYWENFAEPYSNNGIGIYRFNVSGKIKQNISVVAMQFKNEGVKFDMDFNLQTNDKMYCAEYVYKVLYQASNQSLSFHHSFIKQFEFIGVDDIILHPLCSKVKILSYK